MNKKLLVTLILGIFLLSFTSAQPPFQTSNPDVGLIIETQNYEFVKIREEFKINIHVFNSTTGLPVDNSSVGCFFHGYYANGTHAVKDQMVFEAPFDFEYILPAIFFTGGKGSYIIQCNNSEGGFFSSRIEVTLSGMPYHLETLWASIFVVIVLISLMYLMHYFKTSFNFDNYYKKILKQYESKNYVKRVLNSLLFNAVKNMWFWYYLVVLLILMLLVDLSFSFNIISIYYTLEIILSLWTWGLILVGIVIFSYVQEFFVQLYEDLNNQGWGVE